jgi:hypothetical protein
MNSFFLTDARVVRGLGKVGIRRVEIGLDGARPETHDFLRNTPGSFQATVEGARDCSQVFAIVLLVCSYRYSWALFARAKFYFFVNPYMPIFWWRLQYSLWL